LAQVAGATGLLDDLPDPITGLLEGNGAFAGLVDVFTPPLGDAAADVLGGGNVISAGADLFEDLTPVGPLDDFLEGDFADAAGGAALLAGEAGLSVVLAGAELIGIDPNEIASDIGDAALDGLDATGEVISDAADFLGLDPVGGIVDAGIWLTNAGAEAGGVIGDAADATGISDAAEFAGLAAYNLATSPVDTVTETAEDVADAVGETAEAAVDAVGGAAEDVGDAVGDAAEEVGDFFGL
jgi:hypothetical protein